MPKSPSSLSKHPRHGSVDPSLRMSDVALRKKKNADAQAAFRARRANYIATLEETVTSLESVVLQLQDSCREARNESQELRQENARLRHEYREREKFWRGLWQARKAGQGLESDDLPPLPPSFLPTHRQSVGATNGQTGTPQIPQFCNDNLAYRPLEDPSVCQASYNPTTPGYAAQTPSLPYSAVESNVSGDGSIHSFNHRASAAKYGPSYPYAVHPSNREARWQAQAMAQSTSSGGDSATVVSNQSSAQSPSYVESPTLTPTEMAYVSRFPGDDHKLAVNGLDNAPYVFPSSLPHSRSMSPNNPAPGSSTSAPFQFTFTDSGGLNSVGQDRSDFDYRRQPVPQNTEMTLHGGTADITLAGTPGDGVRYRLDAHGGEPGRDHPHPVATISGSDNGSQHERGSSDGDGSNELHSRLRPRRSAVPSHSSRSPSPSAPGISCTVAVIKAQAFGALRRTRVRSKKSSEGAARVAMDVLESRGIGTGTASTSGTKRPHLEDEDLDLEEEI